MKSLGKAIFATAATAVVTAFAVYVATPHFGEAQTLLGRLIREPLMWTALAAVWIGLWCVGQWWNRLQHPFFEQGGWWTAAWFFAGAGLSGWGAYTMYAVTGPLI